MTVPADHVHDSDDDCANCGGAGWVDSCFEDTCVCVDPPCHMTPCDWCNPGGKTQPTSPLVTENL